MKWIITPLGERVNLEAVVLYCQEFEDEVTAYTGEGGMPRVEIYKGPRPDLALLAIDNFLRNVTSILDIDKAVAGAIHYEQERERENGTR